MSEITNKNFRMQPPESIENDTVFIDCNIIQPIPHTAICSGITGLTFRRCNLTNCDVPGDAVIDDCGGVGRHKSRCTNLNPDYLNFGVDACEDDCVHVIDTDEVWIDGELIDTIYHCKDLGVE